MVNRAPLIPLFEVALGKRLDDYLTVRKLKYFCGGDALKIDAERGLYLDDIEASCPFAWGVEVPELHAVV